MEEEEEEALRDFCRRHSGDVRIACLCAVTASRLTLECAAFGLSALLNGLIARTVPSNDQEERMFAALAGDVDICIRDNIAGVVCLLYIATSAGGGGVSANDARRVTTLADAFKQLSDCIEAHPFEPPQPTKPFDAVVHDASLTKFRECLTEQLDRVSRRDKNDITPNPLIVALIIYARSQFETLGYQAPARLTVEEATRDALGETDLWSEYMSAWDLLRYMQ